MRIRHTHASGRFDRSTVSLTTQVRRLLLVSEIVTLTEVSGRERADTLRAMPGVGHHIAREGGANDSAVLWRHNVLRPVFRAVCPLGTVFFRGNSTAQVHATTVVLRHQNDSTVGVSVCHAPAHIEGRRGLRGTVARVRAYRAVMRDWKRHVRDVDRQARPDAWIVSADWNLNFRRPWVRAYLANLWAPLGLRPAWNAHTLPERGGTHGKVRVIDGPMVPRRARVKMRILPLSSASDHRAVRTDLMM